MRNTHSRLTKDLSDGVWLGRISAFDAPSTARCVDAEATGEPVIRGIDTLFADVVRAGGAVSRPTIIGFRSGERCTGLSGVIFRGTLTMALVDGVVEGRDATGVAEGCDVRAFGLRCSALLSVAELALSGR